MTLANNNLGIKIIFLLFTISIIIGTFFLSTLDTPTGRATSVFQETKTLNLSQQYNESDTIYVNFTDVKKITVSGKYMGERGDSAKIYIKTNEGNKFLLAELLLEESSNGVSLFTAKVTHQRKQIEDEKENQIEETKTETNSDIETDDEAFNNQETDEFIEDEEISETETLVVDEELIVDENFAEDEVTLEDNKTEKTEKTDFIYEEEYNQVENNGAETENEPNNYEEELDKSENETTNTTQTNNIFIKEFSELCQHTCSLIGTEITQIIIEIENGELYLETINYVQETENFGDGIEKKVEDIQIKQGENITLNAQEYFKGENLLFDIKSCTGYNYTINGEQITIIAKKTGSWESIIYAIDENTLIVSNKFNITITTDGEEQNEIIQPVEPVPVEPIIDNEIENQTNATDNINETIINNQTIIYNETIIDETTKNITTENETNTSQILGCNHPNPNERPVECIQQENTTYFPEEDLMLENIVGKTIGRFTPIGNLLIKGDFIENSQEKANSIDYRLGYINNAGEFIATVWIDSETGDLHLKGKLNEANSNIILDQGYSAITNKRGILLATINRQTGDMKIRGNVVPYRRSLE